MPCTACSADLLHTFFRTFGIQPSRLLYRSTSRLRQQRSFFHARPTLSTSPSSAKSSDYIVFQESSANPSDVYVPFDSFSAGFKPRPGSSNHLTRYPLGTIDGRKRRIPLPLTGESESGIASNEPEIRLQSSPRGVEISEQVNSAASPQRAEVHVKPHHGRTIIKGRSGERQAIGSSSSRYTKALPDRPTVRNKPIVPQEPWGVQKSALEEKFGDQGWAPRKRLSPDALDGIRALNAQYPQDYTTAVLADQFKVSPEAIRRILKSKWKPNEEEDVSRRKRWQKRGEHIWGQMVELGVKPPKKWREMGIGRRSESSSSRPDRQTTRARSRHIESEGDLLAYASDLAEAPSTKAPDERGLRGRTLSDRIL
ncbi:Required for respiratory growth protein 9 mitochondrial [Ptychographa xylographoides]|nr:Required for respiratory growth protein 9 mitochondrial [Ptychographa xylographoides]